MFERLRRRLSALRAPLAHSPPVVADGEAEGLRDALAAFREAAPERYWRLFLDCRALHPVPSESAWVALFVAAGLVRLDRIGDAVPHVRVFPLFGAFVATDLLSHQGEDQVFSLMLEQVYFVRRRTVQPGDRVLELCVGSGVNSLFAALSAAQVVCVDISERALAFSRFNAALNPGRCALDLRLGSLFAPVGADERFDVILVNPPFEPVPPGAGHYLHSHGGEDGLDVVRELLPGAVRHLAAGGRLEIVTWTPVGESGALLSTLLCEAFPDAHVDLHFVDSAPLDDRIEAFRDAPGYAAWRSRLLAAGHRTIDLVYACVGPGEPGLVERRLDDELALCDRVLAEWD